MKLAELQYELPPELIAQHPAERRDASRLLVLDRRTNRRSHARFSDLPDLLPPGALLVLNDTRVLPAKLRLRRRTGGRVDGLFLRELESGRWEVMLTSSGRLKPGERLEMADAHQLELVRRLTLQTWEAMPVPSGRPLDILNACGEPPLPPYIRRAGGQGSGRAGEWESGRTGDCEMEPEAPAGDEDERARGQESDAQRYQTVYARNPGAIAAPTAGLHFTSELLDRLTTAGFATACVTLHVGIGTFTPIRCENLADHQMHAEWYDCPRETAAAVSAARAERRPVVAVGTTSVRVLETCADESGAIAAAAGSTQLFIYPPYRFRAIDALLTNFHLPGSTLLAMVFAFAGREQVLAAYCEAIAQRYRFYSYGDAMLIR